jgi:hypothetical protein
MHGQGQAFSLALKDIIYIKHLFRNQPTINYGEDVGFTACKKLENHEGKITDEMKLCFLRVV